MKKLLPLIFTLCLAGTSAFPQSTNYGTSSGTSTNINNFFGYFAGTNTAGTGINGAANSFFGYFAGKTNTSGSYNHAFGSNALLANTTGTRNFAFGYAALTNLTTGSYNIGIGHNALYNGSTNSANIAIGSSTMFNTNTGQNNLALGYTSMYALTSGNNNVAIGHQSGYTSTIANATTTGSDNTFIGYNTGSGVSTQISNSSAIGSNAVVTASNSMVLGATGANQINVGIGTTAPSTRFHVVGSVRIVDGTQAAGKTFTSDANGLGKWELPGWNPSLSNVAIGGGALATITTGTGNTAVGQSAGAYNTSGDNNVYLGRGSGDGNYVGIGNMFLGTFSRAYADGYYYSSAIGYGAEVTATNSIVIGSTTVASIGGWQPWSNLSDGRFKKGVKADVPGLEFIKELRPVSYTLDRDAIDKFYSSSTKTNPALARTEEKIQLGFVAQEVEDLVKKGNHKFSGVVAPQNEKDHYSLRYTDFIPPLVKAVQEMNKKITEQQATIDMLTAKLADGTTTDSKEAAANTLVLDQNNPNPFTSDTEIKMSIPESVRGAVLIVYNLQGAQLKSITIGTRGDSSVKISGGELPAGMYLYSLIADGKVVDTKRMILMK